MARQPQRKPQGKASKKASPVRRSPKKAVKAKPKAAARPSKRVAPKKKAVKAKPHTDQARAAVARKRPTPAGASKAELQAEHDHQDPRLAGIPGVSHEGSKVQVENYGQFKNKAVGHLDKPINWFRRGAKPKQ